MEPTSSLINAVEHPDWMVQEWCIRFLLCDKLWHEVGMLSRVDRWRDDPILTHTWMTKLSVCFTSIHRFYSTFGDMPQIGDRLPGEELDMLISHRFIDNELKQLTFTLCV